MAKINHLQRFQGIMGMCEFFSSAERTSFPFWELSLSASFSVFVGIYCEITGLFPCRPRYRATSLNPLPESPLLLRRSRQPHTIPGTHGHAFGSSTHSHLHPPAARAHSLRLPHDFRLLRVLRFDGFFTLGLSVAEWIGWVSRKVRQGIRVKSVGEGMRKESKADGPP